MDAKEREYEEFIRVTRDHQAERERLRKIEQKKNPPIEEYYIDLSQVNTLVESNLVEAPDRGDEESKSSKREKQLVELYGSKEAYEQIRSMEMNIDDHFRRKCQELGPCHFWPVIPIRLKHYFNNQS